MKKVDIHNMGVYQALWKVDDIRKKALDWQSSGDIDEDGYAKLMIELDHLTAILERGSL